MRKLVYISIVCIMTVSNGFAQDQGQAIRFSQVYPQGTARFNAMGGAFTAVGGDFTSASLNPAGLGLFRNSEFTFTPGYSINNSNSNYLGVSNKDNSTNFTISNLGFVAAYNDPKSKGLTGINFAFGYNTLNNFSSKAIMQGMQAISPNSSSLLDNFTYMANNNNELDPFYESLAFETALMPQDSTGNFWHFFEPFDFGDYNYEGYGQEQVRVLDRRGYVGEYAFSSAMNFENTFYFGATMGIHSVRFFEDIYHTETDVDDLEPEIYSFRFSESNSTRGYGVALKLGFIYKPIHILRIGASFHAPITYHLTDDKFTSMDAYWDVNAGMDDSNESSGLFSKEYTVQTPYRASFGTSLLIGKLGLISAEYEYVDYSSADMDSPGYPFIKENMAISQDFKAAHNVRTGFEIRLNPVYLRGGLQYYMNPFSDIRNGSDILVYSGGIGLRSGQTFIDFAFSLKTSSELYGLYRYNWNFEDTFEKAVLSYSNAQLMVTLGYKL